MTDRKPQDQDKFVVRLPSGLRERIKELADRNSRSMNAEIVAVLEEKYPIPKPEKASDPAAKILYWLAGRIRRRNPKSGSLRAIQAATYEGIATDLEARMKAIERTTKNEN